MKKYLLCSIFFLLLTTLCAQVPNDINGFRDYAWDTPYAQMSEGMQKTKGFNPGFNRGVEKTGDDMVFAGIEAHTIIYLFKKDLLNCVSINYRNDQVDSVLTNLTERYGEPKATVNDFLRNYEWHFPSTVMVLSYFLMNESDRSVALGLRKPK